MSIDSVHAATAAAATPAAAPPRRARQEFAIALERHLEEPRAVVADVRAQVAALRGGGALALALSGVSAPEAPPDIGITSMPPTLSAELERLSTGDIADPYGWRALARMTGESVIGSGYGAMFERQIDQESGFAPDVVYGLRVSSAGAEGIAQLMPQFYGQVDRRDPAASLVAGAQSMHTYLNEWDGDVRRALASYNAGIGRVRSLVEAHGDGWEAALPQETRDYLAQIVGDAQPRFTPPDALAR